jgi:hypothetical protein
MQCSRGKLCEPVSPTKTRATGKLNAGPNTVLAWKSDQTSPSCSSVEISEISPKFGHQNAANNPTTCSFEPDGDGGASMWAWHRKREPLAAQPSGEIRNKKFSHKSAAENVLFAGD